MWSRELESRRPPLRECVRHHDEGGWKNGGSRQSARPKLRLYRQKAESNANRLRIRSQLFWASWTKEGWTSTLKPRGFALRLTRRKATRIVRPRESSFGRPPKPTGRPRPSKDSSRRQDAIHPIRRFRHAPIAGDGFLDEPRFETADSGKSHSEEPRKNRSSFPEEL